MKNILSALQSLVGNINPFNKTETIYLGKAKNTASPQPTAMPQQTNQPQMVPQQALAGAVQNIASPQSTMSPDTIKRAIQVYGGQNSPLSDYAGQISQAQ